MTPQEALAILDEDRERDARVIEEATRSYPIECARQLDEQDCERAKGSDICFNCSCSLDR